MASHVDPEEYQREYLVSVGDRPWGKYTVLANEETYKVKCVEVEPGGKLSLQRHVKRDEHWFIQQGSALITMNTDIREFAMGECVSIRRGNIHRIENVGDTILRFIEIQTGDYFGEDDIERLEDHYHRVDDV